VQPDWTPEDDERAAGAVRRHVGDFPNLALTWPTGTNRDWGGSAKGLSVGDTRVQIKNNAEYHGLEIYAWQYMAVGDYEAAADHFYMAALWRQVDGDLIGTVDHGHAKAEALMLRCARFAHALARKPARRGWPPPEDYGLTEDWVTRREEKALSQLDAAFEDNLPTEEP
jgi:hypothetical protein